MADRSAPLETTTLAATPSRPLLSALSRWWSPGDAAPAADPELGYESAHPWTLADDGAADAAHAPY